MAKGEESSIGIEVIESEIKAKDKRIKDLEIILRVGVKQESKLFPKGTVRPAWLIEAERILNI